MDTGKTVSVLGKSYPVELTDRMSFRIDLGDGQELEASSLHDLREKADGFKDVRFNLPFTTGSGTDGSITGFHAGNGSLLVRWASGRTSQERRHGLRGAMPRLNPADKAELKRLNEALETARQELDAFISARKFPDIQASAQAAREQTAGLA